MNTEHVPTHPGKVLDAKFLKPMKKSQLEVAAALGISRRRVNEIVQGKRNITADTAIRLATYFQTSPHFWMDYQQHWDIYQARVRLGNALEIIPVADKPGSK
jgi:addiction module HigA family antidote